MNGLPIHRLDVNDEAIVLRRPAREPLLIPRAENSIVAFASWRLKYRTFVLFGEADRWPHDWAFIPMRRQRLRDALTAAGWKIVERDTLLKEWGGSGQNFWQWG